MPPYGIGLKGKKKLDKPNSRLANDVMSSLGEGTAKEFVTPYGDDRPTYVKQNESNTYGKHDTVEKTLDVSVNGIDSDVEEGWAVPIASDPVDSVFPLDRLPKSSHRDGSIYSGMERWKKRFHVADRGESK